MNLEKLFNIPSKMCELIQENAFNFNKCIAMDTVDGTSFRQFWTSNRQAISASMHFKLRLL